MVDGQNPTKCTMTLASFRRCSFCSWRVASYFWVSCKTNPSLRGRCAIDGTILNQNDSYWQSSILTPKLIPHHQTPITNFTSPNPPFHNLHPETFHPHAAVSPYVASLRFSWTNPRWPVDIEFVRTAQQKNRYTP